jgi:hypothetical protein
MLRPTVHTLQSVMARIILLMLQILMKLKLRQKSQLLLRTNPSQEQKLRMKNLPCLTGGV